MWNKIICAKCENWLKFAFARHTLAFARKTPAQPDTAAVLHNAVESWRPPCTP